MQLKMRYDIRGVTATTTTVATLGLIIACCVVTTHVGWWYTAALASSLGVGLTLLPHDGGYFRLMAPLCLLQGIAFGAAAMLSPVVGAWFFAGLALSVYQLIWCSAQALHSNKYPN